MRVFRPKRIHTPYFALALVAAVILLSHHSAFAAMESSSYKISNDSVNAGGTDFSVSSNYKVSDTAGEIATGYASSASYNLHAGYRQLDGGSITISAPADITMTPLTITQHTAVGSATWTVVTDNSSGYTLAVNAGSEPALTDSSTDEHFTDYSENTPGTPETWSVSNAYEFGYSAFGSDADAAYGSDTDCIDTADVPSATLNWEGFATSTNQVASRNSSAAGAGVDTTVCVATEQDTVFAPSGTYTATITATAVTQ